MNKAYERINWKNYPSEETALNESNLNRMDAALNEVDNRVVEHETTKLDVATANTMVRNISFNERTGIFTVTYLNGSTKDLDTKLEKIATNFRYDYSTQKLILTLVDGTTQEIDMSTLITQYEFADSSYIKWTIMSDGKIKAEIINGSITADKLQPNFLADVTLQANNAKTSEQNAKVSEENAKQSEINAKNYADSAEPIASTAQGLNPTLDNSTSAPIISFKGDGATEQQTYSGKNLFNYDAWKGISIVGGTAIFENNGVTLTATKNDCYTQFVSPQFSQAARINVVEGQTVTLSWECNTDVSGTVYIFANGSTSDLVNANTKLTNKLTYVVPSGVTFITFRVGVTNSGDTISYKNIQVELGETATPYEPFVGRTASPNPSYPQEIYGVGESGVLSVKSTGKNLFDGIWDDTTSKNKIAVKAGGSYIYSESSTATAVNIYFYEDESSNTHLEVKYVGAGNAYIPTQDGFIKLDKSTTTKTECMLEIGSNITAYEPYTETKANIPLSAPLYDGDYIRYNMDGSGELVRKYNKVVYDGTESVSWAIRTDVSNENFTTFRQNAYKTGDGLVNNGDGKCSHFVVAHKNTTNSNNVRFVDNTGFGICFCVDNNIASTVDEWKAWLAENPVTVVYELAEPTVTPLTAEQIAEFEKLQTFDGTTHVTCEAESEISYFTDSEGGKAVALVVGKTKENADHATTADEAKKAEQDSLGRDIASTYALQSEFELVRSETEGQSGEIQFIQKQVSFIESDMIPNAKREVELPLGSVIMSISDSIYMDYGEWDLLHDCKLESTSEPKRETTVYLFVRRE